MLSDNPDNIPYLLGEDPEEPDLFLVSEMILQNCPNCGSRVTFINCHSTCPTCKRIVDSCSDGGRL